jgi:hypothetical protein
MLRKTSLIVSIFTLALLLVGEGPLAADEIAIGAGERGSPTYSLGRAICRLINRKTDSKNCSLLPLSRGDAPESYTNLVNVRNGAADFGLARSDWQHFAITGTGPVQYAHEKLDTLRSVFSLQSQPVTVVARQDAEINSLNDLKGKRVNIGRRFTETRISADMVMKAKNWSPEDFSLLEELTGKEQTLALCHNRVQAIFSVDTHPNEGVGQVLKLCNGVLVNLSGAAIDGLLASKPYLVKTSIAAETYPGLTVPAKTFGATITVVTSVDTSEDLVYGFVKTIFDNLTDLKKQHHAFSGLDPANMIFSGATAPLHQGAVRYFREKGLM